VELTSGQVKQPTKEELIATARRFGIVRRAEAIFLDAIKAYVATNNTLPPTSSVESFAREGLDAAEIFERAAEVHSSQQ
jgi:hypothetical protein